MLLQILACICMTLNGYSMFILRDSEKITLGSKEIWKHPCDRGSSTTNSVTLQPIKISLEEILPDVIYKAVQLNKTLTILKRAYIPPFGKRITLLATYLPQLEQIQFDGLELTRRPFTDGNLTGTFGVDYDRLSRIAVFSGKVLDDEVNRAGSAQAPFVKQMKKAYDSLQSLLCDLNNAMNTIGKTPVADYLSRNIIPEILMDIPNDQERYFRDYIIFHHSLNFIQDLIQDYEEVTRVLQSQHAMPL